MLTLKASSYDWALQHVLRYRDTDVLPMPFEYQALQHDWAAIRDHLVAADVSRWAVRPHRSLLAPKVKYGFRVVTQLDPLDFLVFSALTYEVAIDVEARRVPVAKEVVFSYRVDVDMGGRLFSSDVGYGDFQKRIHNILEDDDSFTHVAVADIADFYHRIYAHRLENALAASTPKNSHVKSIMHLISGWNGSESFGIPVGNQPSRLLAEAALIDVDEAMLAEGITFVRFNDDYRIVARSHAEAYRRLAFLADVLYWNHGLSLQPQKTTVLSRDEFRARFASPEEREVDSLFSKFAQLVGELGLENWYEPIAYEDLDDDQRALLDSLNLQQLLREEIAAEAPDFMLVRFVLRRLGQVNDASVADEILDNLDHLYPAFADIVEYLGNLHSMESEDYQRFGGRILDALQDSILSELEYHRLWGLDLFATSTKWNHEDRFFRMLAEATSPVTRRKLILAMGRANQRHWFQTQWRNLFNESPWPKRAIIAAASCLPVDARRHWYNSIESRLDVLESAVMRWAKANPF